jgi:hypothetical protein
MSRKSVTPIVASVIGIFALCVMVTSVVAWMSTEGDYLGIAVTCNLVAILIAIAAWTGALWKGKNKSYAPASGGEWLGIFAGGCVFTFIFLLMDCGGRLPAFHPKFVCDGNPGIGAIFTFGAIAMTAVALPSALRAWIISKFGDSP